MSKTGKKLKKVEESLKSAEVTSWKSGLDFIIKNAYAKFDESVDADIVLGIDASRGEQTVRGSVLFEFLFLLKENMKKLQKKPAQIMLVLTI